MLSSSFSFDIHRPPPFFAAGCEMFLRVSLCLLFVASVMMAEQTTNVPLRVAIVTGGTRGIGRGITEALADIGRYKGFLLTYNTNKEAAETFVSELEKRHGGDSKRDECLRIKLVGGDISLEETRDAIFECLDIEFPDCELCAVIHSAGQYVGITSENAAGLEKNQELVFGDGSLMDGDKVNLDMMRYYQRMYGEAYVDLCERGLKRMREACARRDGSFRGSLVGISSPGCNFSQRPSLGYDMPGSGKCVMEYAMRLFAVRAGEIGVNCNVVIPGATQTEAWSRLEESISGMNTGMMFDKIKKKSPMGEGISPREIGDVVAFLCGDHGGRFITGVSLSVDAGLHLLMKN